MVQWINIVELKQIVMFVFEYSMMKTEQILKYAFCTIKLLCYAYRRLLQHIRPKSFYMLSNIISLKLIFEYQKKLYLNIPEYKYYFFE